MPPHVCTCMCYIILWKNTAVFSCKLQIFALSIFFMNRFIFLAIKCGISRFQSPEENPTSVNNDMNSKNIRGKAANDHNREAGEFLIRIACAIKCVKIIPEYIVKSTVQLIVRVFYHHALHKGKFR